ncbi:MAG: phytase, partial [Congregibacter sp.]|nr:phytase [Congregibacter sp.]
IGSALVSPFAAALKSDPQTLSPSPAGVRLGVDGDVQVLGRGDFLVAGTQGLQLRLGDRVGTVAKGRFESLDGRSVSLHAGNPGYLVSAIDAAGGSVIVILADKKTGAVVARREIEFDQATPDAACLYQDSESGFVSLFSIDARGMLEQRFVFAPQQVALINLQVRQDPGVLGAKACAVHDPSASLFIYDEAMGVRQLPASEESDAIAQPWMLPAPWGALDGEVEDIAVDETGTLWALVPDSGRIYRRSWQGDTSYFVLPPDVNDAIAIATDVDTAHGVVSIALVREDSGDLYTAELDLSQGAASPATDKKALGYVYARSETTPVRRYGDAADDPAIYSGGDSETPLILGTDKREGLAVYDLDGNRLQLLSVGRLNNVDIVSGILLGGVQRTIAAASNRDTQSISLFEIANGEAQAIGEQGTGLNDVYGLCMYSSDTGVYVFINDTDGGYEQYRLGWSDDSPTAELVRAFRLPSQPEGCVADSTTQRIYMGEEAAGVWMAGA